MERKIKSGVKGLNWPPSARMEKREKQNLRTRAGKARLGCGELRMLDVKRIKALK